MVSWREEVIDNSHQLDGKQKNGKFNETKDFEIINKIDKVLRRLTRNTKIK